LDFTANDNNQTTVKQLLWRQHIKQRSTSTPKGKIGANTKTKRHPQTDSQLPLLEDEDQQSFLTDTICQSHDLTLHSDQEVNFKFLKKIRFKFVLSFVC
jgi:hypothetical protein